MWVLMWVVGVVVSCLVFVMVFRIECGVLRMVVWGVWSVVSASLWVM